MASVPQGTNFLFLCPATTQLLLLTDCQLVLILLWWCWRWLRWWQYAGGGDGGHGGGNVGSRSANDGRGG